MYSLFSCIVSLWAWLVVSCHVPYGCHVVDCLVTGTVSYHSCHVTTISACVSFQRLCIFGLYGAIKIIFYYYIIIIIMHG